MNRPLVPILAAFIGGLLAAQTLPFTEPSPFLLLTALLMLPALAPAAFPPRRASAMLLLPAFFLAGAFLDLADRPNCPLQAVALQERPVMVEGTALEPCRHCRRVTRFPFRVDRLVPGTLPHIPGEKLRVSVYGPDPEVRPGQRIRFPARLSPFRNFHNPGGYDYEAAMEIKGFSCAASVSDGRRVVSLGRGTLGGIQDTLEGIRAPLRDWFHRELDPPNRGLMQALILGERQEIAQDLREAFQVAGLAHMLAVSGLHVGLVAWLVFTTLYGLLSRSYVLLLATNVRKATAAATCVPVIAYALVAGFHVSTQRALIMVLAYLVSILVDREKDVWSTLGLAALLILAADPRAIHALSFQLSFGAVVGILWLAPSLYRRIPNPFQTDGPSRSLLNRGFMYTAGLLCVTLAAVVFLLPLTVFTFHRISLVAIPANLLASPLLGLWILPLGLLATFLYPLFPSIAALLLQGASLGLDAMTTIVRFLAGFDLSAVWTLAPTRFELVLLYVVLISGVFSLRGRFRPVFLAACIVLVLDAGYWIYDTHLRQDLRVTHLDVGQGNAALVQFPGGVRMLIDGGGFRLGGFDVGRMVVAPYLWRRKIGRVHYLVLSHPQADHMNGLHFIAKHFAPQELWSSGDRTDSESFRQFMKIVREQRIAVRTPGDSRIPERIAGVDVDILHPQGPSINCPEDRLNDRSLVLRLSFADTSFLFPGDIEQDAEAALGARAGLRLRSDVLLAPHHGSRTSSTKPFLALVRPAWCVISAGAGNRHGMPHTEALERMQETGSRIVRTDEEGAIQFTASPGALHVQGFHSGTLQ
ncbi:MAG: DNA internalization-related competence protein ComEC/Rec2 [Desulfobacteraceae bacterium]|jgi:competence protein ComEC